MTFKKITYTIFFLITGINGMAQNNAIIDSLLYQLNITSADSVKADIYNNLCWNYRVDSPKLGYEYGTKALKILIAL